MVVAPRLYLVRPPAPRRRPPKPPIVITVGQLVPTKDDIKAKQLRVATETAILDAAMQACATIPPHQRTMWAAQKVEAVTYAKTPLPWFVPIFPARDMIRRGDEILGRLVPFREVVRGAGCDAPPAPVIPPSPISEGLSSLAEVIKWAAIGYGILVLAGDERRGRRRG